MSFRCLKMAPVRDDVVWALVFPVLVAILCLSTILSVTYAAIIYDQETLWTRDETAGIFNINF